MNVDMFSEGPRNNDGQLHSSPLRCIQKWRAPAAAMTSTPCKKKWRQRLSRAAGAALDVEVASLLPPR